MQKDVPKMPASKVNVNHHIMHLLLEKHKKQRLQDKCMGEYKTYCIYNNIC